MSRPIFIGGTGRCGTSVLRRCLGLHPDCSAFDTELRVLVNPGGLLDLLSALDLFRWDPWRGDDAVHRFLQCAKLHFNASRVPTLAQAVAGVADRWTNHKKRRRDSPWKSMYETSPLTLGEQKKIAAAFLEDLAPEKRLVDDTPTNVCASEDLERIYPECTVVHVIRHPRDVLGSMAQMKWGAPTWDSCARRIAGILRCAEDVYQIRLEDLVAGTSAMRGLLSFCELDWHEGTTAPLDSAEVRHYDLDAAGRAAYEEHLADLAVELRY